MSATVDLYDVELSRNIKLITKKDGRSVYNYDEAIVEQYYGQTWEQTGVLVKRFPGASMTLYRTTPKTKGKPPRILVGAEINSKKVEAEPEMREPLDYSDLVNRMLEEEAV